MDEEALKAAGLQPAKSPDELLGDILKDLGTEAA